MSDEKCLCGKPIVVCFCAVCMADTLTSSFVAGQDNERRRIAKVIKGASFAHGAALTQFSEQTGVDTAHTKALMQQLLDSLALSVERSGPDGSSPVVSKP